MHSKQTASRASLEQPTECGLLHITYSLWYVLPSTSTRKIKTSSRTKKCNNLIVGIFWLYGLFPTETETYAGSVHKWSLPFQSKAPQKYLCSFGHKTTTVTPIRGLLQNAICCPAAPADHLFSTFKLNFTNKTRICQKSVTTFKCQCLPCGFISFFVYGVTVYSFFSLYHRRLLNDNYSLLLFFN